jgi:hypothetical protein
MKGNNGTNRILYHDTAAKTITEPPPCFTVGTEAGILYYRLPWVFSKCKLFLMWGTAWRTTHLTILRTFLVVWCPDFIVATPPLTHLSITFSNKRFRNCSFAVDVRFVKLMSDSFCGNRVFMMNIQFCSSSVIFWNNPSQYMTMSFSQCWFSHTVPFHSWCLPLIRVCWHHLRDCRSQYT